MDLPRERARAAVEALGCVVLAVVSVGLLLLMAALLGAW